MQALTGANIDFPGATPGFKILSIHPVSLPVVYPRSMGNSYEWSVNLKCIYLTKLY